MSDGVIGKELKTFFRAVVVTGVAAVAIAAVLTATGMVPNAPFWLLVVVSSFPILGVGFLSRSLRNATQLHGGGSAVQEMRARLLTQGWIHENSVGNLHSFKRGFETREVEMSVVHDPRHGTYRWRLGSTLDNSALLHAGEPPRLPRPPWWSQVQQIEHSSNLAVSLFADRIGAAVAAGTELRIALGVLLAPDVGSHTSFQIAGGRADYSTFNRGMTDVQLGALTAAFVDALRIVDDSNAGT